MSTVGEQTNTAYEALVKADTELAKLQELISHQRSLIANCVAAFRSVTMPGSTPAFDAVPTDGEASGDAASLAAKIAGLGSRTKQPPKDKTPPVPAEKTG